MGIRLPGWHQHALLVGRQDRAGQRELRHNLGRTSEVGSYRANPWGLFDMHGNVWEWVEDCWSDRYDGAPDDGSAWTSGDCRQRVLRGGTWRNVNWDFRSANRFARPAHEWVDDYGFRVARMLDG
jgi:formylglycine-generating enzyme required for sulfatase activity